MPNRHTLLLLVTSTLAALADGCSQAPADVPDHHVVEADDDDDDAVATTSQPLVGTDPVSAAVSSGCSTSVVKGLAVQLVQEIECLRPGTMKRIDGKPGIALSTSAAAVPFLQIRAADALVRAQKARGTRLKVNSGLRTLPQQYLLYRWYRTNRCGIGLAAVPGTSNHESGVAVDIDDNAAWRTTMEKNGFRWLGARDPVHFNYAGSGSVALAGLSIKAFQRLWNRNHPDDRIDEDGDYGPATEARLMKAPIGGFAKGPSTSCTDAGAIDAGAVDAGSLEAPEGSEPTEDEVTQEDPAVRDEHTSTDQPPRDDASGCTASAAPTASTSLPLGALALALAAAVRSARRAERRTRREPATSERP